MKINYLLCGVALAALVEVPSAVAQPSDQTRASSADGLEEIVVTARRREEKLQTVPIAISAVSGDQLKTHEIANATDLGKLIPSVSTQQTNRDFEGYTIRGLSGNGSPGGNRRT